VDDDNTSARSGDTPLRGDALEASKQAWERLKGGGKKIWDDWMVLGEGLYQEVCKTLNRTGVNDRNGGEWSKVFGPVLKANLWIADIDPSVRSRLMEVMENRGEIQAWLDTLDRKARIRLNHPTTVLSKWRRVFGLTEPKPRRKTKAEEQAEANIELQGQLDAIYKQLAVETFEDAEEAIGRLKNEDAFIEDASPALRDENKWLKAELDKATVGLSNSTDELTKVIAQRRMQATTLAMAVDMVRSLAKSNQSYDPELVERAGTFVAELFPENPATAALEPNEAVNELTSTAEEQVRKIVDRTKKRTEETTERHVNNEMRDWRKVAESDLVAWIGDWLRDHLKRDEYTPLHIQSDLVIAHAITEPPLSKIKEIIRHIEPKKRGRKLGWRKHPVEVVEPVETVVDTQPVEAEVSES
jgi:hypothetical protein